MFKLENNMYKLFLEFWDNFDIYVAYHVKIHKIKQNNKK